MRERESKTHTQNMVVRARERVIWCIAAAIEFDFKVEIIMVY